MLDWADTWNTSQCSRTRVQGASRTGGASDGDGQLPPQGSEGPEVMASCLLPWFSAEPTEFLDIMMAEEGVSSSHLQNGLVSRCHSLQVRSPSTTFQLRASISHF